MKATIRSVAEAVGLSPMAVSAVLNGGGRNVKVSAEKAELIRRVAKEQNYQPNSIARALRNRRTHVIGLVFQHFERFGDHQPYYPQLFNGVVEALFAKGYTMALCPKMILDGETSSISDGRFDGVLWCRPDFDEESLAAIRTASVPVVMMHAPPGAVAGIPTFCSDNAAAMRRALNHLVELGHKKIAFVVDELSAGSAEALARADAARQAGLALGVEVPRLVWDDVAAEIHSYAERKKPHTALVCYSDGLAGQVLDACRRLEVHVPSDLSVVGFDSSSFCERTNPKLTSLNQPVETMAKAAVNHLLSLIEGAPLGDPKPPTVSYLYDCGLDVRESTGPVPPAQQRSKS